VSTLGWPPRISAKVTDNIGVDTVFVEYSIDDALTGASIDKGEFGMIAGQEGDVYSAAFPQLEGLVDGDEIGSYRLFARDVSNAENVAALPPVADEPFSFIVAATGTVAYFDFEGSTSDVATTGSWEHGTPSYGVLFAHSGSGAWATRLDRSYPDFPGTAELVLPSMNLSGLASAWLEFWHWYDIEHDGTAEPGSDEVATLWDGGLVQVSTDGGGEWVTLIPEGGYDGIIAAGAGNPMEAQPAFGGFSYGWRKDYVLIPAGPDVRVRFVFAHDVSNQEESRAFAGWVIDDVSIRIDRPADEVPPQVVGTPPLLSEAEAGDPIGPLVSVRATDDVGVEKVEVTYELSGSGGLASGVARLNQSGSEPDLFEARIPVPPASTLPVSILTYRLRVFDFDGNSVDSPGQGDPYRVEYVFVSRQDQLVSVTPTGGWSAGSPGWLLTDDSFGSGSASLVLSPVDLPSDAADVRFELVHEYDLAGSAVAHVKVSTGAEWQLITPREGYPDAEHGFAGQGAQAASTFDLNSFAGEQIQLRVELESSEPLGTGRFWRVQSATTVIKASGDSFTVPRTLELHPNFPDPFAGNTTISFTIPEPTVVDLALFDLLGRKVGQLINEPMEAGTHTIRWSAGDLAAGTYYMRLITKSGHAIESISVLK
jgi:hypothetical protein